MLHALTFSIIEQLRTIPEAAEVVWLYDGVTLIGRPRPLITVEQRPNDSAMQDKSKTYFSETYRFQIGLRANTATERARVGEKLKTALRASKIPFYDTNGSAPVRAGFFSADVVSEVPMPSGEIANETDKHRVYYDVDVKIYRTNGSLKFD